MENDIRQAIVDAFGGKNSIIFFQDHNNFIINETHVEVISSYLTDPLKNNKSFLKFSLPKTTPLFHSLFIDNPSNLTKFHQLFNINQYSRADYLFINEFLTEFAANKNLSRFLKMTSLIKNHEFYTFEQHRHDPRSLKMLKKSPINHGITSCVNRKFRLVGQYSFIKQFGFTRDKKISIFPTVVFEHVTPFSLYFDLNNKIVYKLPQDLSTYVYIEDIVAASTVFTVDEANLFTDEVIMMYVQNLYSGLYSDFSSIPTESLSEKIDLLMMSTI